MAYTGKKFTFLWNLSINLRIFGDSSLIHSAINQTRSSDIQKNTVYWSTTPCMLLEIYRHFGASVNKYHKASYPRRSILHNHRSHNFKSPTDIAIAELSVLVYVSKHQSKIFALQRLVVLFILHFNFVYSVFGKYTWPNTDRTFIQLGSITRRKTKCDDSFIHLGFSSETETTGATPCQTSR
jgi:hypothetical protein